MIEDKNSNKIKKRLSKVMTHRVRKFLGEVCQVEAEAASEEFDAYFSMSYNKNTELKSFKDHIKVD